MYSDCVLIHPVPVGLVGIAGNDLGAPVEVSFTIKRRNELLHKQTVTAIGGSALFSLVPLSVSNGDEIFFDIP